MKETVFTHPSQLHRLHMGPFLRTKGLGKLVLGGNLSDHPQKEIWERELNRRYYACGCEQGAIGLLSGMLVGGVWQGIRYLQVGDSLGEVLLWVFFLMIVGALAGKFFGLMKAKGPLKEIISEIRKNWKVKPHPESPVYYCG